MAKKTKLRSGWEKSFEDFVELSGTTLTPGQRSSNNGQEDEQMHIDEDDIIDVVAESPTTSKTLRCPRKGLNYVSKIPDSPDIDDFIHNILNVTDVRPQTPESNVTKTEVTVSRVTDSPNFTQSIDRFIREVIAPTTGNFSQSFECSSEVNDNHVGHPERSHNDSQSSALLFSSTESNVSCTQTDDANTKHISLAEEPMPSQEVDNSHLSQLGDEADIDCPTQYISNSMSTQAVGEWNIASCSSMIGESTLGTPELSSRLSVVPREVESDEVDSDPTDKLESSGMAQRLRKIIQREQSDQSVCRHKVLLANQQLEETPPDCHVTKLVVTESPDMGDDFIQCLIVSCTDNSLSVGSQAKLASSSLRSQTAKVGTGDEVVIYWPWRILNSEAIGTVIFTASYCEVNSSIEQEDQGAQATPTLVTKAINCPCSGGGVALYPYYKGPRAFLHQ